MTTQEIKCEIAKAVLTIQEYKACGLSCNMEQLQSDTEKFSRYLFLKKNVICGDESTLDCMFKK